MIPRRLVRTVPAEIDPAAEQLWQIACDLHPDWEHVTWRDPVDRAAFPLTAKLFDTCESGAQLADLIRAEDLLHRGGVYIDSDVQCYRPFDALLGLDGFAGWDCADYIPNAIMGFRPGHQAIKRVVELAIAWHHRGTWQAGVGATTEVFQGRTDMALLPPGSFYPVFWRDAHNGGIDWDAVSVEQPWSYCAHKAWHSWRGVA